VPLFTARNIELAVRKVDGINRADTHAHVLFNKCASVPVADGSCERIEIIRPRYPAKFPDLQVSLYSR